MTRVERVVCARMRTCHVFMEQLAIAGALSKVAAIRARRSLEYHII